MWVMKGVAIVENSKKSVGSCGASACEWVSDGDRGVLMRQCEGPTGAVRKVKLPAERLSTINRIR